MHGSAKWRQREMTSSTDGGSRVMPFQSLLLHHQVFVSTERRLALGSIQTVLFLIELDGLRPKRTLVKVMDE